MRLSTKVKALIFALFCVIVLGLVYYFLGRIWLIIAAAFLITFGIQFLPPQGYEQQKSLGKSNAMK